MGPVTAHAQDRGSAALFDAIRANDLAAVKQIVASGADPRARNEKGLSAPQAAVRMGHHVIAHFLLAHRRPRTEPPVQDAIDQALDRAVAETEESAGPIPEVAIPGNADAPVTLPEPTVPLAESRENTPEALSDPSEIADLRDAPAIPPHDKNTPVLIPIPADTVIDETAPLALTPQNRGAARPGENTALPPPPAAPAMETTQAEPPAEPTAKAETKTAPEGTPGLLSRAKGWLGGLLGFGDNTDTPTEQTAETQPGALTPPPAEDASPARAAHTLPPEELADTPPDLDKLAARTNPALDAQKTDLPAADLPQAVAQETVPDDPLGQALAQREGTGEPLPDGDTDPLLSLFGDQEAEKTEPAQTPPAAAQAKPKVDLMAMAPKDRLAWLDSLLAKPIARNAEDSLAESRDEAFSHLRDRAGRKAADTGATDPALSQAEKDNLETDTSAVEGPPKGTNLSRRLKIPLPPPDPKGRKNFARDPWFRDVSPDEPDVRAAHRSLKAAPPERGAPAPSVPKVPQLANLPKDKNGDQKVAANVPQPPPIRETPRPQAPVAAPKAATGSLDALEKEFGGPSPANDPLAAELGLAAPTDQKQAGTPPAAADPLAAELGLNEPSMTAPAPAADPLAAELGLGDDEDKQPAADPLAAELGIGPSGDEPQEATASSDPLSQALGDLSNLLDSDAPSAADAADAAPPTASPEEILSALPAGSEVRLDAEGRPVLPSAWTLPVVLPGQAPPIQDLASAYITPVNFRAGFDKSNVGAQLGLLPPGANTASAWPVTKIQMADGAVVQPPAEATGDQPRSALANQGQALEGVTLSLGAGASLYNTFVPENAKGGDGRAPECIDKAGGQTQFCIKELQWPAYLEPNFLVSTILYTGTASVVRFDNGAPTRMHVVFAADGFADIADWLVRRFGPPTSTTTRSVAPFGQTRRENPTMVWRAIDRVTQKAVSLEIRNVDDTRDGFPDIRNGVMMLYREGAPGIFPQVSVHELMRLKRTG